MVTSFFASVSCTPKPLYGWQPRYTTMPYMLASRGKQKLSAVVDCGSPWIPPTDCWVRLHWPCSGVLNQCNNITFNSLGCQTPPHKQKFRLLHNPLLQLTAPEQFGSVLCDLLLKREISLLFYHDIENTSSHTSMVKATIFFSSM